MAGPMPSEVQPGGIHYFFLDTDSDGIEEPYGITHADPNFYPGIPSIYRIEPDGSVVRVFSGPENSHCLASAFISTEGPRVFILWYEVQRLDLVNGSFEIVGSWNTEERGGLRAVQIESGGPMEMIERHGNELTVWNPVTGEERRIPPPEGELLGFYLVDVNQDARIDIILLGKDRVEFRYQ